LRALGKVNATLFTVAERLDLIDNFEACIGPSWAHDLARVRSYRSVPSAAELRRLRRWPLCRRAALFHHFALTYLGPLAKPIGTTPEHLLAKVLRATRPITHDPS
jgi:hypothetical protein